MPPKIPFKTFRRAIKIGRIKGALPQSKIKDRPVGDCFRTACKLLHDDLTAVKDARLVHGMVNGSSKMKGKRFSHAWVELGDTVFDFSGGKRRIMRKEHYYNLGGIKKIAGEHASYSHEEAYKKLLQHQHWGPWDLKDSDA